MSETIVVKHPDVTTKRKIDDVQQDDLHNKKARQIFCAKKFKPLKLRMKTLSLKTKKYRKI